MPFLVAPVCSNATSGIRCDLASAYLQFIKETGPERVYRRDIEIASVMLVFLRSTVVRRENTLMRKRERDFPESAPDVVQARVANRCVSSWCGEREILGKPTPTRVQVAPHLLNLGDACWDY